MAGSQKGVVLQISDEHQVTYDKGQHLRGRDAELADQVCAEMVRPHASCIT